MRIIYLTTLLILASTVLYAQDQLRVVGEGKIASGELVDQSIRDVNGQIAAGILIKTDLSGLSFDANNGIIKTNSKSGEYLLFVSPGERIITIRKSGYLPLKILLPEVSIRLKSGEIWSLTISGDKKLEQVPLHIQVTPEDVVVELDGKKLDPPYSGILVSIGKHEIKLSKEQFGGISETIEVSAKKSLFIYELKPVELQVLTLKSEPEGATIFINGLDKGLTNKQTFVYPGLYTVKWSLNGYLDKEQQIEVKENVKNEFTINLEKNTGTLNWIVYPVHAQVLINKEAQSPQNTKAELASGRYLVEIIAEGYDSQSESIELKRDETLQKNWSLTQQTGGLQFSVEPYDARVSLKRNGQTVETWTGLKIFKDLPVGEYEISAELSGYQSSSEKITITKDKTFTKEFTLKKGATSGKTIKNSIGMEFVLIPAGTFQMGSNESSDEKPIHEVTLSQAFYMGKYEVTQKEWKAIMGDNPSGFRGDNLPVEKVSWNDVQEFVQKLNQKEGGEKYRLPTEAEWEYAARAGSKTKWHFGDNESQLTDYAWYNSNSNSKTHDVGQKKPNQFGLYDMHGNVWEWVQDWYDSNYIQNNLKNDFKGPSSGSYRLYRGGSWNNYADNTRSADRDYGNPKGRFNSFGFRLVRLQ